MTAITRKTKNYITWNESLTNARWIPMFCLVTGGVAAPDGSANAFDIEEDNTPGVAHYTEQYVPLHKKVNYLLSVYAKASNRSWLQLSYSYFGAPRANFNLQNGTMGTVAGSTAYGISSVGNGWYFCWYSVEHTTQGWEIAQFLACSADDTTDYDGLDQSSIYLWHPGLDTGYIPDMQTPTTTEVPITDGFNVAGGPP
jgi:hypothetical protein